MSPVRFLLTVAAVCVSISSYCAGSAGAAGFDQDELSFDESKLDTRYGAYSEVRVSVQKNTDQVFDWQVIDSTLPQGLSLQTTQAGQVLIFGNAQFTNEWCFVLSARSRTQDYQASSRLCFYAEEDDQIEYPRFDERIESVLDSAIVGQFYQRSIPYESGAGIVEAKLESGFLPVGINLSSQKDRGQFLIQGRSQQKQSARFILKLTDQNQQVNARQFELWVEDENSFEGENTQGRSGGQGSQGSTEVSCAPGYYYDDALNYCVQAQRDLCGPGTYYDLDSDQCVRYPTPPSHLSCQIGYYFDPFLVRCVYSSYPRCPLNYEWDSYWNRCVRQPYTCSWGERYDWNSRVCIRVTWGRVCPLGTSYDWLRDRCVNQYRSCYSGYYFDPYRNSCYPHQRTCVGRERWDPYRGGCRVVVTPGPRRGDVIKHTPRNPRTTRPGDVVKHIPRNPPRRDVDRNPRDHRGSRNEGDRRTRDTNGPRDDRRHNRSPQNPPPSGGGDRRPRDTNGPRNEGDRRTRDTNGPRDDRRHDRSPQTPPSSGGGDRRPRDTGNPSRGEGGRGSSGGGGVIKHDRPSQGGSSGSSGSSRGSSRGSSGSGSGGGSSKPHRKVP